MQEQGALTPVPGPGLSPLHPPSHVSFTVIWGECHYSRFPNEDIEGSRDVRELAVNHTMEIQTRLSSAKPGLSSTMLITVSGLGGE